MGGMQAGPAARRRRARLSAHDVAALGLLAAVALIFGYIEALFPLPVPIPGVKLGLGNVVVLFALVVFGWRAGLLVMVVKVVASALLFGNPTVFFYSLAGGAASYAAMCAGVRLREAGGGLSVVGVSMLGGAFHIAGQLAVVAFVLAPYVALAYLPVLLLVGTATGCLTGYVCRLVVRTVGRSSFFAQRRKRLSALGGRPAARACTDSVSAGCGADPDPSAPDSSGARSAGAAPDSAGSDSACPDPADPERKEMSR